MTGESFIPLLKKIDDSILYIEAHVSIVNSLEEIWVRVFRVLELKAEKSRH